MRKVIAAIFVSMDGVLQSPGAPEEDPSGGFALGGWMVPFWDEQLAGFMAEAMGEDYDLLLGRRSYEMMAAFWPYADGEFARKLNGANKYVVARADSPLTWSGSQRLQGDAAKAVAALKETQGRPLVIQGSRKLIQALLAADVIDEITTLVIPVVLGSGKRLFEDGARPRAWTLTRTRHSPKGVVVSTYERAGDVPINSHTIKPSEAELARRARLARES
jgi:dihydrofolate reductase